MPFTDEMIFDAFRKCQNLKDKTKEEEKVIKGIADNLVKYLNKDKKTRIELYETLTNIVSQHGH